MAVIQFEDHEISQISGYTFEQPPKIGDHLTTWDGRDIVRSVVTDIQHQQMEGYFSLVVVCKFIERAAIQSRTD